MKADTEYMKLALAQARVALERGEVPIGAVVVASNRIIAKGYNMTESLSDVTAHAEMITITQASRFIGNKYLSKTKMFVTLQPCPMCATAIRYARLSEVIYAIPNNVYSLKDSMVVGKQISDLSSQIEAQELVNSFFEKKRI